MPFLRPGISFKVAPGFVVTFEQTIFKPSLGNARLASQPLALYGPSLRPNTVAEERLRSTQIEREALDYPARSIWPGCLHQWSFARLLSRYPYPQTVFLGSGR